MITSAYQTLQKRDVPFAAPSSDTTLLLRGEGLFPSLLCSVALEGPFKSFHYGGRKQSHDSLAAGPTSVDYIPLSPFPCLPQLL